jgi:hypothetical protein
VDSSQPLDVVEATLADLFVRLSELHGEKTGNNNVNDENKI